MEKQLEIVEELKALDAECDRLVSIYQKKLANLAELKQCLLQKAFSGELTADAANKATDEAVA